MGLTESVPTPPTHQVTRMDRSRTVQNQGCAGAASGSNVPAPTTSAYDPTAPTFLPSRDCSQLEPQRWPIRPFASLASAAVPRHVERTAPSYLPEPKRSRLHAPITMGIAFSFFLFLFCCDNLALQALNPLGFFFYCVQMTTMMTMKMMTTMMILQPIHIAAVCKWLCIVTIAWSAYMAGSNGSCFLNNKKR